MNCDSIGMPVDDDGAEVQKKISLRNCWYEEEVEREIEEGRKIFHRRREEEHEAAAERHSEEDDVVEKIKGLGKHALRA